MITILSTTPLIAPVYNPIYVSVSSDKTTEEGFNFIFDLYVNGVFVNRDRLQPRPGTTQCVYSPAGILASYVSYDLSQNTIGVISSNNCIDMYEIKVAEEYVAYWYYQNNSSDTILGTSFVKLNAVSTPQPFNNSDEVLVIQDLPTPYIRYNGAHTIVASNTLSIVINVNYAGGNVSGRVCYADKRKTLFFLDPSIIFNSNLIQADAGWALPYGPDSCGVRLDWAGPTGIQFVVPDVSCLTAVQDLFNAYPYVSTNLYKVKFTISAVNNPSNEVMYVTPWVGGNFGTPIDVGVGAGTYEQYVTGGGLSTFKLILDLSNVDTSGFGSHSIQFSKIELIDTTLVISGYDINAVVQYEAQNQLNYTDYKLQTGTVGKFLTYSPRTLKTKLTDKGSLGILLAEDPQELFPGITYSLNIDVTDVSGTITNYSFPITGLDNASLTNDKYQHLGVYPWNINQLAIGQGAGTIIDTFTKSYKLHINGLYLTNDLPVSETFNFEIEDCTKYEPVRFMFKNSLGSFDYFNATLLSRTTINTSRDTFVKTLGYGYQIGDRGKTVLNVNSQESYIVWTNWISEATAHWLAYEFHNSNEVYVFDSTQRYIIPIILDNSSIEDKKIVNDGLLNYQFNYSKAVTINTARG